MSQLTYGIQNYGQVPGAPIGQDPIQLMLAQQQQQSMTPEGMPGLNGQPWGSPNPAVAGPTSWMGKLGVWMDKNGSNINTGIQSLGQLYSIWQANKQMGLMKDQLAFQKESFGQNMANSIQSYNTSLADRINGRTSNYAGKEADVAAYLAANSLKKL